MGVHAHPIRRAGLSRRTKILASAGATVAAAAAIGGGVYGSWTSTDSITSGLYTAATVTSSFTDTGTNAYNTAVSNMLPGDYSVHYADLVNSGTVKQDFTGAVSDNGGGLAAAGGLQITIDSCSVAWTQTGNGTCSGTTTSVLAATDVASHSALNFGTILSLAHDYLRVTLTLPATANQATFQGTSATVTITETGSTAAYGGQNRSAG